MATAATRRTRTKPARSVSASGIPMPAWIPPQLAKLVKEAPDGPDWLHEIKFDGYRMYARLDRGAVRLLTRTGLDWTHKYPPIVAAASALAARQDYLDGELCGVFPDGITSFGKIQAVSDAGNAAGLVFFAARRAAAAHRSLRLAAGPQPRALGAAGAGGRSQVSYLD